MFYIIDRRLTLVNEDTEEPIFSQKDLKPQDKIIVIVNDD